MTPFDVKLSGLRPPAYSQPLGSLPRARMSNPTVLPSITKENALNELIRCAGSPLGYGPVNEYATEPQKQYKPLARMTEQKTDLMSHIGKALACMVDAKDSVATLDTKGLRIVLTFPGKVHNCAQEAA